MTTREVVRGWRDEGRGHFCRNGTKFQMDAAAVADETFMLGVNNLIPFGHVPSRIQKPKSINYPIPACGDHRLRWHYSFMHAVS